MPDTLGSSEEPILLHAHLTPNRSLTASGQTLALSLFGLASLATSLIFVARGYWPVAPFILLDLAILAFAFLLARRRSRAFEDVIVRPQGIVIRRSDGGPDTSEDVLPTAWTSLARQDDPEFGCLSLSLHHRRQTTPIAQMLSPSERAAFGLAMADALARARRGGRGAWEAASVPMSTYGAAGGQG